MNIQAQPECSHCWIKNLSMILRCVPALPDDLQKDLYGAAASYISSSATKLTSLSSSLNTNSQRLRRYISDINRGKWLIIAAGKNSL